MRLFVFILCLLASSPACAGPTVEEMAGSMIMVGFRGETPPPSVLEAVHCGRLGGVILFDRDVKQGRPRNIGNPGQVRALTEKLQKASPHFLFIAVDQEGGLVRRLRPECGFAELPSAERMGAMSDTEVMALARRTGREMARLGINVDLAPVVDIRKKVQSPGLSDTGRLFGSSPALVTDKALAFSRGLEQEGIIPVLKHFPGLGSAKVDSHIELPDVTAGWEESELEPYREAFRRGWKGMVLAAHVYHRKLDRQLPSSLSPAVIDGLLRGKLGWNGVVISDDLQMGAAAKGRSLKEIIRLAILAGNDILLFGNNLQYDEYLHDRVFNMILSLIRDKEISRERIRASWDRIQKLRASAAGAFAYTPR